MSSPFSPSAPAGQQRSSVQLLSPAERLSTAALAGTDAGLLDEALKRPHLDSAHALLLAYVAAAAEEALARIAAAADDALDRIAAGTYGIGHTLAETPASGRCARLEMTCPTCQTLERSFLTFLEVRSR